MKLDADINVPNKMIFCNFCYVKIFHVSYNIHIFISIFE